ncbi:MAG: hypothetical protein HYU31_16280 [Deltaproteobacteria bacterium]|nr:hypothetical protein [Deltaproteobacteria bacterium]MBI2182363.1 hypothetical protein [Deltaproteobacteria bacterium]MBI2229884.1 hypothetical protein [Deltaproteobacteria bacterium]MBI2367178.1 hypothetical protein [Deltaproteobacteria bacterium]MBI2533422.1 hypothetical protein [Deltaproteobacteria bacterium]
MFGKGVHQEEEALLRDILRSIDKKIDFSAREGEGSRFNLHVSLRGHAADIALDLADLKAAITDIVKRRQIRQKIKARCDHLDQSRYGDDILGLRPAKLLRASPKPEITTQRRPFARSPRR